jgi:AcrR family transcriptional regulator
VKRQEQRERVLAIAVELVLEVGLGQLTFRTLARRADTSDRMLLYYFADKRELVMAILEVLSQRFRDLLVDVTDAGPTSPRLLLLRTAQIFDAPAAQPLALVWLELTALAHREPEIYRPAAERILAEWRRWLDSRLAISDKRTRAATVDALLTICDGLLVHGLVGGPTSVRRSLEVLSTWAPPEPPSSPTMRPPARSSTRRPTRLR